MSKKGNISARTVGLQQKTECFERNIAVLNIIFYIGKGFMLRKQIITLTREFYKINEHSCNDMLQDLAEHGLLIRKQATDTQTFLYIMTKFSILQYKEIPITTRDVNSIKLNNRKIWNNIYRAEFIIREVIPLMENSNYDITLQNMFCFLNDYSISIFTTENQTSVYQLYQILYNNFPIKDKGLFEHSNIFSPFLNDLYKANAELYNYNCNFLGYEPSDSFSYPLEVKEMLEREKDLLSSPKEVKKNYYNLFNMIAAGFFFVATPDEDGNISIGTFDKYNNMYLKKIYENIIYIALMLERYLGYFPHIFLKVYMSDLDNLVSLKQKEKERGYDFNRMESMKTNKRESYFYNLKVPRQYYDYITVEYVYYPLREKYNI